MLHGQPRHRHVSSAVRWSDANRRHQAIGGRPAREPVTNSTRNFCRNPPDSPSSVHVVCIQRGRSARPIWRGMRLGRGERLVFAAGAQMLQVEIDHLGRVAEHIGMRQMSAP